MLERHELERVEPNVAAVSALLDSAERSIKTARLITGQDPDSALTIAWDRIAFQALAAMLMLAGYRVTSQQGHHRVAVEAGRLLLRQNQLLSRIGTLRRTRDRGMYEHEPAEKKEVEQALRDCEELLKLVRTAAGRARNAG